MRIRVMKSHLDVDHGLPGDVEVGENGSDPGVEKTTDLMLGMWR
jgi:hypothetical protein